MLSGNVTFTGPRKTQAMTHKTRFTVLGLMSLLALSVVGAAVAHRYVVIRGTNGDNVLTGTPRADKIFAKRGNDTVTALSGHDLVFAGPGNDSVDGGPGRDRIFGGYGNDILSGSDGNDVIRGRHGNDTVDGGLGNDRLWVGHGADVENGGEGDDVLHALANDDLVDTLDCGPGIDRVWLNSAESDVHVNCEQVRVVTSTNVDSD